MTGAKKKSKKTSKKKSSKKSATRKKKVTSTAADESEDTKTDPKVIYKDIEIAYLAEGLSAVQKLIEEQRVKAGTVRRAAKELAAKYPDKADMLRKFVENNFPETIRGRLPPVDGDEREYKAQQVKNGAPFLRLPLDVINVKKGQIARVRFTADKIEVWKAPAKKAG